MSKHKTFVKVEGLTKTKHPLYTTYKGMLARCNHPNSKYYSYYGGRGIKVCKRWLGRYGFVRFVRDMGPRPEGYTLERKHNNGNYSQYNCIWAPMSTQSLNRRLAVVNTSGYVGIHHYKATGKWSAYIDFKRKRKHLGYFDNLHEAIEARRKAEDERSKKHLNA
jgi:hypothetical protein